VEPDVGSPDTLSVRVASTASSRSTLVVRLSPTSRVVHLVVRRLLSLLWASRIRSSSCSRGEAAESLSVLVEALAVSDFPLLRSDRVRLRTCRSRVSRSRLHTSVGRAGGYWQLVSLVHCVRLAASRSGRPLAGASRASTECIRQRRNASNRRRSSRAPTTRDQRSDAGTGRRPWVVARRTAALPRA
jgi:hypothetical protein